MSKKLFKAQALAIVMLILVIASIMGVALFSRMAKDKDISINEQDSAIALAQVDAMLDYLIGADIAEVEGIFTASEDYTNPANTLAEFVQLLRELDVLEPDEENPFPETWCTSDDSSVKLEISLTDSDTYVEVQPGSVLAFNLEGLDVSSCSGNCTLIVNLKAVANYSAFLVKRVMDDGTEVTESKENYCITDDGSNCTSSDYGTELGDVVDGSTWSTDDLTYEGDGVYYFTLPLDVEVGNDVVEIRVLPISGILAFNNVQPEGVTDRNFIPIKVAAEATCNVTRGEEMYLPGSGLLGYSTLFDYGIYDNGFFQP